MRRVREVLRDRGNPVTVGVLTDEVRRRERIDGGRRRGDANARAEESVDSGDVSDRSDVSDQEDASDRGDVHEDLVTRVLPTMESEGTVAFDERRGRVRAVHPLRARLVGAAAGLATRSAASIAVVAVLGSLAVVPVGGPDPAAMLGAGGTAAFAGRLLAWLVG